MGTPHAAGVTVRDFMSRNVLTVDAHSNVNKTIDLMAEHNVGSVVILDSGGPKGIFTERDLLSKVLTRGKRPDTTLIREVVSPLFADVGPSESLEQAAKKMVSKKSRLMVFEGKDLTGIVTATDLVRIIHGLGQTFDISKVVTKKVVAVGHDTTVEWTVQEMDAKRIGSVIVNKEGKPWGIFTERDLLVKILAPRMRMGTPVGAVATSPLTTAPLGIDGKDAAGIMVSDRIKRLPLTEGENIRGIVTARDLVEAFAAPTVERDVR